MRIKNLKYSAFSLVELMVVVLIGALSAYFIGGMVANFSKTQRLTELKEAAYRDSVLIRQKVDICRSVIQALITQNLAGATAQSIVDRKIPATLTVTDAVTISTTPNPNGFALLNKDGTAVISSTYNVLALYKSDPGPPIQSSFTYQFSIAKPTTILGVDLTVWGDYFRIFTEVREGNQLFIDGTCDIPL